MKKLASLLCLNMLLIMISCGKKAALISEQEAKFTMLELRSTDKNLPIINSQKRSNINSDVFKMFINLETKNIKEFNIQSKNMFEYKFQNLPNFSGLYIELEKNFNLQKDILFVIDKNSNKHLALIREISGFNGNKNGVINFKNLDGTTLVKHEYINGKLISKANENQVKNSNFEISTLLIEDDTESWRCTSKQFNDYYQKAKNECESDWMCDLACSFNPCALAYLASAIIECSKK